ncbi:lecithin retinol acyltransferase family protein [Shewanella acanthi]|uniref:lecithin retinol acyltransferase family protein n=1 Tax=Shewanella acanthi TaxID=2864212 RepID=UPI001C661EA6|nr:lecithin retinol acyltransferase family protein [Shewanella acanthi]QYJ80084.1 TMEM222 family protein [Shewanella acanthi]
MPLPLLYLGGAALGALVLADERDKRKLLEHDRLLGRAPKTVNANTALIAAPSQWQKGFKTVSPIPGAIVCCYVFGVIEHTGIWLDDDCIVELHGSGLIRAVSVKRFLAGRTGSQIFIACNHRHQPLVAEDIAKTFGVSTDESVIERAGRAIYQYRDYDLFDNNCHRFVWFCLTGDEESIKGFMALNQKLAGLFKQGIYWDEIKLKS